MSCSAFNGVRVVVFDYGNTLIEFGRRQIDHCDGALGSAVRRLFGPFDTARFDTIREENRMGPYRNGYRESRLPELTRQLVETLFQRPATDAQIDELVEVRFAAFVECIAAEAETHQVLERLKEKHRLALLSNYPCGRSIRASLSATGLDQYLSAVVVSGDVGFVKPHPTTYRSVLDQLGAGPAEALFVGDNWLADVQGAKRAGLPCVHMRRWVPPEHFEPQPSDHAPDATIRHLDELPGLLV
jgi:HAD superfamily hydrolase (TIGR01549 family)